MENRRHPLLAEQRAEIHQNIRQYSSELENVLKATNHLESELQQLRQEKINIQLKLESCTCLLAPIHDIPNDVLYEIFLQCMPQNTSETTLNPLQAPLLLCHICTRWREVAMNSPMLWRALQLDMNHPEHWDRDVVAATDWLMRAKMVPTEFQLKTWNCAKGSLDFEIYYQVQRLFPPTISSHLQSLYLDVISEEDLRCLPSNISFPLLHSLVLKQFASMNDEDGAIKVFEHAPQLRHLCLESASDRIAFPWLQLTHLIISDPQMGTFLENVLPQCTLLQALTFVVDDRIEHNNRPLPPIVLPTLSQLKYMTMLFQTRNGGCQRQVIYPPFFDAIEFPCLASLRLVASKCLNTHGFTDISLSRFLEKTIRYLSLCFNVLPVTVPDLRKLLNGMPYVSVIDLECRNGNYQTAFEALIFTSESNFIAPSLKTLIVELGSNMGSISDTVLFNRKSLILLLESRLSSSVEVENRLQEIIFYITASPYRRKFEDLTEFLQPFVERGLEVNVRVVERGWRSDKNYWIDRDPNPQESHSSLGNRIFRRALS